MVCFPTERLGAEKFTYAMHEFSYFISAHGLVDLPLEGGYFTWFNIHGNVYRSRIDSFLFSTDWEDHFPNISQRRLRSFQTTSRFS